MHQSEQPITLFPRASTPVRDGGDGAAGIGCAGAAERLVEAFSVASGVPVRLLNGATTPGEHCGFCRRFWAAATGHEATPAAACLQCHAALHREASEAYGAVRKRCCWGLRLNAVALRNGAEVAAILECGPFRLEVTTDVLWRECADRLSVAEPERERLKGELDRLALCDERRGDALADLLVCLAKGIEAEERGSRPPFVAKVPKIVFAARQYTEENVDNEGLTLAQVARHVRRNPDYLSKVFQQTVGTSFTEYLNRIRVDRVCALLDRSPEGIAELAMACGFGSVPHFNRVFRRYTGMSPSAYREERRRALAGA